MIGLVTRVWKCWKRVKIPKVDSDSEGLVVAFPISIRLTQPKCLKKW